MPDASTTVNLVGPVSFDGATCEVDAVTDEREITRREQFDTTSLTIVDFDALASLWKVPLLGWTTVNEATEQALERVAERYPFAVETNSHGSWRRLYIPAVEPQSIRPLPTPMRTVTDVRTAKRLLRFGPVVARVSPRMRRATLAEAEYWDLKLIDDATGRILSPGSAAPRNPNVWHWMFSEAVLAADQAHK